ncbi:MAG: aspartate aminotransferase family protein [Victivallaceae bacterium]|nr:aspartate aminotransferase family protein [Victivallaceae bacterium]
MNISTKYRKIKSDFELQPTSLLENLLVKEPEAVLRQLPITWAKAKDSTVSDDQGNQWIDMTSGIFVTNAGHANPAIKAAIKKQLDNDLLFSYNYPTTIRNRFLGKLLGLSPKCFSKAVILNSGSEAVDAAYKLIKQWGAKYRRKYIISFSGSYHGRGLSNDLIGGGKHKAAWAGIEDKNVIFLDFPYDGNASFPEADLPHPDEIAAFVLETFQGWGAWFYPRNYLDTLVKFARKAGSLICFDDLQGGFYRLGTLYGYQSYGIDFHPDILCLGKGMASSLPISAVLCDSGLSEIDPYADLHGTHSANPLSCAAALANLEFLSDRTFLDRLAGTCTTFERETIKLKRHSAITHINVRGMIAGIITRDKEMADKIVFSAVRRGVLPVWTHRNSIKLAPPLTIPEAALVEAITVISEAATEAEGK